MIIHGDFETRSELDLKEVGLDVYARHPSTDVWCFGWAVDDSEPHLWTPGCGALFTTNRIISGQWTLQDPFILAAHNAPFELAIWNHIMVPRYGWPVLRPEQTRCTMAMAYAMSLPGSLENAAAALGLTQQKDLAGHRLMMQMSRPRDYAPDGSPIWWDEFDKQVQIAEYCKQDVRTEQALWGRLLQLSPSEQQLWELDYQINQRGIHLDRVAINKAIWVVKKEVDRLNGEMQKATNGEVCAATEVATLTKWIQGRGVPIDGLAKADVIDALKLDYVPADVRKALLIRQEAGKTSTAKLHTMITCLNEDDRARGLLQYHAAGTGRWGGRRIQTQNFPRPSIPHEVIEQVIEALHTATVDNAHWMITACFDRPMTVISDCLRGMICAAPGSDLVAADFANIEGRVLAWLAGEQWKLDAFAAYDRKEGPDIYKLGYAKSFRIPVEEVTKDQRFIGKVQELALGYQGGVGAFQTMARGYGVVVSDALAEEIKTAWREAHPNIVKYWYGLEDAAKQAVTRPGQEFIASPGTWGPGSKGRYVTFLVKGSFLFCKLPSGRVLTYPYPKLKPIMTPWGEEKEQIHYMSVDGKTRKWQETHTYGGKLAENVTQAVSRDILADAMLRVEKHGFPIVMHVHDEIVAEVSNAAPNTDLSLFEAIIAQVPAWAAGLPIAVEGWKGKRYRK
jgi:DNA polymerase